MSSVPSEVSKYMGNAVKLADIWGSIIYNVKAYGAKGNGVNDDTISIQKAIDAASLAGGGVVFFPVGIYNIKQSLIYKERVNLIGANMWASTLNWASNNNGTMINTANVDLRGSNFCNLRFTKSAGTQIVTGILGGSLITKYNSAIARFENLFFFGISYGIRGDAEPTGVGIFDSTFINIWCANGIYGLWFQGSENVIIQPRITGCTAGIVLDFLNPESFASIKVIGGIFIQNGYDVRIPNGTDLRSNAFFGSWFEQSINGIIEIVYPTPLQSLTFDNCTLSSSSTSFPLMNLNNAIGQITLDTCIISQSTNNALSKTIVEPSSSTSRLEIRNTEIRNYNGSRERIDTSDSHQLSAAHVYQTVQQSIPATTFTPIDFDTERYDNQSEFDITSNLFTAKKDGIYQICASIRLTSQVAGNRCLFALYRNGSTELVLYDATAGGTSVSAVSGSAAMQVNAGDTIGLYLYSVNAVTTAAAGSWNTHFLTITKISN